MSGDVVNLRRVRKQRQRAAEEAAAAANRLTFGTSKAVKDTAKAEQRRAAQRLSAHRREPDDADKAGR